mmetsp:Transcript_657/g.1314  ORF Transcript_657/g.1314 Transcript_657/m.1314 type:complete len:323 (+) Transcript_657:1-969(+)
MTLWQHRPSSGSLSVLLAAGISGIAVGLATGLWIHFGGRKRRQLRAEQQRPMVVGLEAATEDPPDELQAEFTRAAAWVSQASDLATTAKLALYGCYKQATSGDCPPQRPWGMEASAKWEAWHEHRGASKAEAMRRYIEALGRAAPAWRAGPPGPAGPAAGGRGRDLGAGMATGPAQSLLQSIGDPSQAGAVDETPVGQLCESIAEDDLDAARAVLRQAPQLAFQSDRDGMTPLHWACDRGRTAMVKELLGMLGKGSDALAHVNMQDGSGDTPLHFAVLTDNEEIARLLLASRADPQAKNSDGESPWALAEGEGWCKIFGKAA